MKSCPISKNAFFTQYDAFINAIQKNKPQKVISALAQTILNNPLSSSIKAKDQLHKIEDQLKELSPRNKKIQSLVNKVLKTISSSDTAAKNLFLTFKTNCDKFIKLIRNPNPVDDDKDLAATALLEEAKTISSLDNTQVMDLLSIKVRLRALSKRAIKTPIKDTIKSIIEKLDELAMSLPERMENPSAANPVDASGIVNSGNDCFLIALCQLLRNKSLTEHLVNRLPKELWEPLVADNSNAKYIRRAIVDHTQFGSDMNSIGADPMTSQLDADEALMALFGRIDEPDKPPATTSVPVNTLRTTYNANYAQATSVLTKVNLFTIFWMTTISETIQNGIVSLFLAVFRSGDDGASNYTPHITVPRPQNRPRLNASNPLQLHIKNEITYTPAPGTPVRYRNHENFGGPSHKGVGSEQTPYLPLAMEKTSQGIYTFEHILKQTFSPNDIDDAAEVSVITKKGKKTYKAAMQKKIYLEKVPNFLLLSLKRSLPGNKKNNDPVEGLDLEITLPEAILGKPFPAANRKYTLQSFVSHLGSSSGSGHYVAYRKEAAGWHYFNDESHSIVSEKTARKAAKQAYLVFYERKGS